MSTTYDILPDYEEENKRLKAESLELRRVIHIARKTILDVVRWHDCRIREIAANSETSHFTENERSSIEQHLAQSLYLWAKADEVTG